MRKQDQDEVVARAKAALKRIEQQSEKTLGVPDTDEEFGDDDPVVKLGKKIGRGIGFILLIIIIWHLVTTYYIK